MAGAAMGEDIALFETRGDPFDIRWVNAYMDHDGDAASVGHFAGEVQIWDGRGTGHIPSGEGLEAEDNISVLLYHHLSCEAICLQQVAGVLACVPPGPSGTDGQEAEDPAGEAIDDEAAKSRKTTGIGTSRVHLGAHCPFGSLDIWVY